MPTYVTVAQAGDIPSGSGKVVNVDNTLVALFNVDGAYYAISNTCVHRGGPLGEGVLEQDNVTCPWHGWRFNVKTGCNSFNPQVQVKSFPVKVEEGRVQVSIEP